MRNTLIVLAVLTLTAAATAYDPPEVIGYIEASDEDRGNFACDFCWVGDQNGDGYDDLLVSNNPCSYHTLGERANRVELYYGGEEIDDEYDLAFPPEGDMEGIGRRITYICNLSADLQSCIATRSTQYERDNESPVSYTLKFFAGGDLLDDEVDFKWPTLPENYRNLGWGRNKRPSDLNGDGYNDFIATERITEGDSRLIACFGGEDFDTIPDWSVFMPRIPAGSEFISTGYDVNGDGYDDIIYSRLVCLYLFLGGEEMDTVPALEISQFIEGDDVSISISNFSLLPDVNDDGYDDLGAYYREGNENGIRSEGYFIWFGSEEPDDEYDLVLEGHGFLADYGDLTGGDFNGDGIGDIAACSYSANHFDGEINIYFGSRWIDGEADISVNPDREYGREYEGIGDHIGAVGDYNGDSIDDFVVFGTNNRFHNRCLAVFAGDDNWEVGVRDDQSPDDYIFNLDVNPNPFNSNASVLVELPSDGPVSLDIYDIQGRLVSTVYNGHKARGEHVFSLEMEDGATGIYFVLMRYRVGGDHLHRIEKIVKLR